MTMIQDPRLARAQYNQDAILSASPQRLLTMLFDRLLLDLQRAEAAQSEQDWNRASGYLVHAQDIVAELTGSLDVERWDGAQDLLAIRQSPGPRGGAPAAGPRPGRRASLPPRARSAAGAP